MPSRTIRKRERDVPMLRIAGLTKQFGSLVAVDHLDLDVYAGEVVGFLGPNGSGKSTIVGMILGLVRPTSGRVELFGEDVKRHPEHVRQRVGAIIEGADPLAGCRRRWCAGAAPRTLPESERRGADGRQHGQWPGGHAGRMAGCDRACALHRRLPGDRILDLPASGCDGGVEASASIRSRLGYKTCENESKS